MDKGSGSSRTISGERPEGVDEEGVGLVVNTTICRDVSARV